MGGEEKATHTKENPKKNDHPVVNNRRSTILTASILLSLLTTVYLYTNTTNNSSNDNIASIMRHTGSSSETNIASHHHYTADAHDIEKARTDAAIANAAPHHFIINTAAEQEMPYTPLTPEEEEEWRRHHIESVLASLLNLNNNNNHDASKKAYEWILSQDERKLGKQLSEDDELAQRFILATLFFATNHDQNTETTKTATTTVWKHGDLHWLSSLHECHWNKKIDGAVFGVVRCDDEQRVTHLFMPENLLVGTIPPQIGFLKSLQSLDLNGNSLHGSIPDTMSFLTNLNYLGLSGNSLTGNVPESFAEMYQLEQLLLHFNQMTNTIPQSVCNTRDPHKMYNTWTDCLQPQTPQNENNEIISSTAPPVICECCQVCCDRIQNCEPVEITVTNHVIENDGVVNNNNDNAEGGILLRNGANKKKKKKKEKRTGRQ